MTQDAVPLKPLAERIAARLSQNGHTALFAGGCVRDLILGQEPQDYDIATTASTDEIEALFAKTVPVGKQFGVVLVLEDGMPFEVATFRKEGGYEDGRRPSWVERATPEEDAKRRDFTVNGLFYDPQKREVIDYVHGQEDIKQGIIRTIGNPEHRFGEDKLRLIRAVRFAANLNFQIEENTWNSIRKNAPEIKQVSPERIRDELSKIFTRKNPGQGLELLDQSGLLAQILPEICAMKGCEQDPEFHPEGDVFVHTKLLLDHLQDAPLVLALGALFHDVAKPVTFTRVDGKIHFYSHEKIGEDMTREIMGRLRFSNKEIDAVAEAVKNHMKFAHVQQMRQGKLRMFLGREWFREELELHRIDCQSSHGKLDNYEFVKQKLDEYKAEDLKPKPFITGKDLLELGFKPGPKMGALLEELYERQLDGEFADKNVMIEHCRLRLAAPEEKKDV